MLDRRWARSLLGMTLICWSLLSTSLRSEDSPGPQSPTQSREHFRLADPQLTIELIASEPAINSPVSMTWDAKGRMYVVEMSDYPTAETGGKIKQLLDRDGDGLYETGVVFAEGLTFPNGVLAWNGGLLVTCAPDVLFLKDTDGDGHADERRVILTGFAEGNQQLRVNGLYWGLDNWVYGANGRSGGDIRRPVDPPAKAVSIRRQDFRFRPESGEFEAIAGLSQFGLGHDDFNRRFPSWNTIPFRHVVIEERDLNRNPHLISGNSIALIADSGDTGRVYPISSPPKTFNRERTDYFNASCGTSIFRGVGLGRAYLGNAFVGEPLTNLVHRKILEPQGATFVARRGEQQQEFLASTDSWFHPVNFATGPDGCLYLADFYREWVEHPQFVHEELRKNVDFRTGNQHGRIWRIRRSDFQTQAKNVDFVNLSTTDLARQLDSTNAWNRDTAQRLLVERQDSEAIRPVEKVLKNGSIPAARAHALWTLAGLKAIRAKHFAIAVKDESAEVREQAFVMYRVTHSVSAAVGDEIFSPADDSEFRVRFQVALAAGDLDSPLAVLTLAKLTARDGEDEWARLAILSGVGNTAWPFLQTLTLKNPEFLNTPKTVQQSILRDVAGMVGSRQQPVEIAGLCQLIAENSSRAESGVIALLGGLAGGLARHGQSLDRLLEQTSAMSDSDRAAINTLFSIAQRNAADRNIPVPQRLLAFELLIQIRSPETRQLISSYLSDEESPTLQSVAAAGLADLGDDELARQLLERWETSKISTRRELIDAMLHHMALTGVLIDALERGTIRIAELDFAAREKLARIPHKDLQTRAAVFLKTQEDADRDAVVRKYQSVLDLRGDGNKGAFLFSRECLGCHQMKGIGARVGPDLSGVASRPKAALLVDVLNPSKEMSPDFVNYVVVTKQGKVITGLLVTDSVAAVKLRRSQGVEDTIMRTEIEEIRPYNKSLMPEGIEQKLSQQDFADLLEFLQRPVPLPSTLP